MYVAYFLYFVYHWVYSILDSGNSIFNYAAWPKTKTDQEQNKTPQWIEKRRRFAKAEPKANANQWSSRLGDNPHIISAGCV